MNNEIPILIADLRQAAETHISHIQQKLSHDALFEEGVQMLVKLVEFEQRLRYSSSDTPSLSAHSHMKQTVSEHEEINKVCRRLKLWAKKPEQFNSRLVALFLRLQDERSGDITEEEMRVAFKDDAAFYRNFPQLKTISTKNHGKVFDVEDGIVRIWPKVQHCVDEFKAEITKHREASL